MTELHIPRGTERSLVMQAGTPDGRYPYAVFCHAGNCFAKGDGGTEPVIIIP